MDANVVDDVLAEWYADYPEFASMSDFDNCACSNNEWCPICTEINDALYGHCDLISDSELIVDSDVGCDIHYDVHPDVHSPDTIDFKDTPLTANHNDALNDESNISIDFIDIIHDLDMTVVSRDTIKDKCGESLAFDMHLQGKSIMNHDVSHVEFVLCDDLSNHCETILSDHLNYSLESLTLIEESHIDFVGCSKYLEVPTFSFDQFLLGSSLILDKSGLIDYIYLGRDTAWCHDFMQVHGLITPIQTPSILELKRYLRILKRKLFAEHQQGTSLVLSCDLQPDKGKKPIMPLQLSLQDFNSPVVLPPYSFTCITYYYWLYLSFALRPMHDLSVGEGFCSYFWFLFFVFKMRKRKIFLFLLWFLFLVFKKRKKSFLL